MLLVLDVGNSNISMGLYGGTRLEKSWRLETVPTRTADEYLLLIANLLSRSAFDPTHIQGGILASVVPVMTLTLREVMQRLFSVDPLVVGPELETGIPIAYDPPQDVGADRIVNAVAAYARFRGPCVIVDFGTATTFDSIGPDGTYAGGAIAPGIRVSMDALTRATAKLPRVDFKKPAHVVGTHTIGAIQSGIFFGYVALVEGLVMRMKRAMNLGMSIPVLGTGGLARLIAEETPAIDFVNEDLTLEGLRILYERNTRCP